jgi:hypothetical protein
MESQILFFSRQAMTKLHAMILFYFLILSKTNFDIIHHDVHVHTLHLYEID